MAGQELVFKRRLPHLVLIMLEVYTFFPMTWKDGMNNISNVGINVREEHGKRSGRIRRIKKKNIIFAVESIY